MQVFFRVIPLKVAKHIGMPRTIETTHNRDFALYKPPNRMFLQNHVSIYPHDMSVIVRVIRSYGFANIVPKFVHRLAFDMGISHADSSLQGKLFGSPGGTPRFGRYVAVGTNSEAYPSDFL